MNEQTAHELFESLMEAITPLAATRILLELAHNANPEDEDIAGALRSCIRTGEQISEIRKKWTAAIDFRLPFELIM
ncbi:MAG: hypothetical protein KF770_13420 [Anaerolineae bacterium]|nr:hypothetical protein [Anaerolineae bacterium]